MANIAPIQALSEISDQYDAILCDVWGVIHNGRTAFLPAADALANFRAAGKPVILMTNAPRPSDVIPGQLARLGVRPDAYDGIVSSGDATIAEIKKHGPKAYKIGPEKDEGLYDGLDVAFVGPEDADYIICTGLRDELSENAQDYLDELTPLAARKLPMICANPDKVVQYGNRLIACAGALADVYEALGGPVIMAGKPFAPIYELSHQAAEGFLGKPLKKEKILCIGDGLFTDVKGANEQGYDCLFIAEGIHAKELENEAGQLDGAKIALFLAQNGRSAIAAMAALA